MVNISCVIDDVAITSRVDSKKGSEEDRTVEEVLIFGVSYIFRPKLLDLSSGYLPSSSDQVVTDISVACNGTEFKQEDDGNK